jgi:hypothetical protein
MLILLACLGLITSAATTRKTTIEAKSRLTETIRTSPSGHPEASWTRSEVRLHLLVDPRRPFGTPGHRFLLREESYQAWDDASEGVTSKLTFQRLDRTQTGYDSLAWSLNAPAQSASFYDGMLQTLRFGCCDQEDEYRYYAPSTGRLLAITTHHPLPVHGHPQALYLGFRPAPGRSDRTPTGWQGELLLFSATALQDSLPLRTRSPERWSPVIRDLGDRFRLTFDEGDTIDVVVDPDCKLHRLQEPRIP